jgi:hypothetical protein
MFSLLTHEDRADLKILYKKGKKCLYILNNIQTCAEKLGLEGCKLSAFLRNREPLERGYYSSINKLISSLKLLIRAVSFFRL